MPTTATRGDEVLTLFGAVRLRAVWTVRYILFIPSEMTDHKVGRSGARFIMFGTVQLRAVQAASHELFVQSERIRAATQVV